MYPIFVAFHLFGHRWENHTVLVLSDNYSVVNILSKLSSRDKHIMVLVREMVSIMVRYNFKVRPQHLPGVSNLIADKISRLQDISSVFPLADAAATPVPRSLHWERWYTGRTPS